MTESLELDRGPLLGRVTETDASRAVVELSDPSLLRRVTVSDLVSLPARDPGEQLIGLVETVSREERRDASVNGAGARAGGVLRAMLIGTLARGPGGDVFKRGASSFPHVGSECRLIEGELLQRFMSTLGENVPPDERLALGRFVAERGAVAIADANRLFQRHAALLGSTGSGKSWTIALMLERAARLAHPNMIVFDMHGEYAPLAEAAEGRPPIARRLRIAGPGDLANTDDDVLFVPYWLLDRDEMLSLILDETDPDAPNQAMRFSDHVRKLKVSTLLEEGYEETAATVTVDSPVPYRLPNLLAWLRADDEEKIVKQPSGDVVPGPFAGRLTRFISRLDARAGDGRYGFMFNPPPECLEYEWLVRTAAALLDNTQGPGIKVIDFSEVPAEALPVVAGVLARLLYDVQFWTEAGRRTPLCFVCDEAHLYMPTAEGRGPTHREALCAFEQIAKEGRKYGVGLLIVSQRPADVSRTVLAQCNNFIVLRLTNDQDQEVVGQLVPHSLTSLTDVLPLLDVGEALVLGDALLLSTRVKLDPPAIKPASATRDFWSDWSRQASSEQAIVDGVEALRRQVRPGAWAPR